MQDIYLDNSATTAVCKEAVERMVQVMTVSYGNPSSLHQKGIEAEDEMDRARRAVAARLNCTEREIRRYGRKEEGWETHRRHTAGAFLGV